MQDEDENWVVVSDYTAHDQVLTALQGLGIEPESAELGRVPQVTVKLEGKQAASVLRMIDAIEEQDDVQNVFANFEIDDEELEKLSA
jgi:transcriptional/translational regulatory protein YebC/TACO1